MNDWTHVWDVPDHIEIIEYDSTVEFVDTRPPEVIREELEWELMRRETDLRERLTHKIPANFDPKVSLTGSPLFPAQYVGWCSKCLEGYLVDDLIGYVRGMQGPMCAGCHSHQSDWRG